MRFVRLLDDDVGVYPTPDPKATPTTKLTKGTDFYAGNVVSGMVEVILTDRRAGFMNSKTQILRMDRFNCLIPDGPLTGYEKFAVGMTTGGAYRGMLRPATMFIESQLLILRAQTDVIAGGNVVTVAKMPLSELGQIRRTPISTASQMRTVIWRSVIVGGGLTLTMIIIPAVKGGPNFDIGRALPIVILFGLGMGFVFSFLPGVKKIQKNLFEIQFVTSNAQVLPIALQADQMESVAALFSAHGLKFTDLPSETPRFAQNGMSADLDLSKKNEQPLSEHERLLEEARALDQKKAKNRPKMDFE